MAYAALAAAGIVLVIIVVAVLRRDSRHWMRRPVMADYRASVTGQGLSTVQQKRLERLTRRGRAVPVEQVPAAALYAGALLEVSRKARTRTRRQLEICVATVGAVTLALYAWVLATGEVEWSAVPVLTCWLLWTPFLAFRPAVDRWFDERLGRAVVRDAERRRDDAVR